MTLDPVIAWSIRLALALLFGTAAWHKLSDRRRFEATLEAYSLLPPRSGRAFSWLLPASELAIAAALLLPTASRGAAAAAGTLLLLYSGAIAINLGRGRHRIDCGCFASGAATPLSGALLLRNAALITATLVLLLPEGQRPLVWIDGLSLLASLIGWTLVWEAGQRLARTGPALREIGGVR